MLLIGQFDSPFVRRVGIAMRFYGLEFEHRPHAVFRDAELIARFNPLRKVPTLVLDDGTVLTESTICLEILDGRVATDAGGARPLLPRSGPEREAGLRVCGFVVGALDKAVTLLYERVMERQPKPDWQQRCELQLRQTLAMLERERSGQGTEFWLGTQLSHVDVAISCAITFLDDALAGFFPDGELPALRALAARCEAMPEFANTHQAFVVKT